MDEQTKQRLPKNIEAERGLLSSVIFWPERAAEIIPLVAPICFFEELHKNAWKAFREQLATTGEIDAYAVGKKLNCAQYFIEMSTEATTSAHCELWAKQVREASEARNLYAVLDKASGAILRGYTAEAVLGRLDVVLGGFREGVSS